MKDNDALVTTDTALGDTPAGPSGLAPWLQTQLEALLLQRGHAWLLSGPSGLGQFELALALARAWLCEQPDLAGACGHCGSCHAVAVHSHPDLCMLLPETLSLALGWPLDEKTQDDLDAKKRKPSKEIKVDAARQAVTFTQFTRSRGTTRVVLVFPAERMNAITANTLLKTLEEPPGSTKFVLATESAHQLLPTIRSRCLGHTMVWPELPAAMAWLARAGPVTSNSTKRTERNKSADSAQLLTLLKASGGRPLDAVVSIFQGVAADAATHWRALPKAVARGDVSALSDWSPAMAVDALQKICHDAWLVRIGAQPRFFEADDLPGWSAGPQLPPPSRQDPGFHPSLQALALWWKELDAIARTVEHPYSAGLLIESLVSRAGVALAAG